jgi:acyl-CoA synthetase (AMP-forming)/AMP-acid ligase II
LATLQERDSPKLLIVAAWQLLSQLGSKILLQFLFVLGWRKEGFDCPDIWHSPISVWQLPESLWQKTYFISNLSTQASKRCLNKCLTLVNFPADRTEVKIIDDEGRVVPRGTMGELCTRAYSTMLGYWDEPEKTKQAITPDRWFHTG